METKFSKTFTTTFFPVGEGVRQIVADWVTYLRTEKLSGNNDPLFPKTLTTLGKAKQFEHMELARDHWANATPVRGIFRQAFVQAGLPYYHPHSLWHTLAQMGERLCHTPTHRRRCAQDYSAGIEE